MDATHPVFNFPARLRSRHTPHYGHIPPTFLGFLREVSNRGVSRRRRMIGRRLRPDDDVALPDIGVGRLGAVLGQTVAAAASAVTGLGDPVFSPRLAP